MKTKINALALYMASDEVIKGVTSKNLDKQEEIQEKIEFLEQIERKEINIKGYDEESVFISQYPNSKKYQFPLFILESEENEENEQIEEKENILDFKINKKMIIAIWLLMGLIFGVYLYYKNGIEQEQQKIHISQFELNYNRINEINLEIAKELEIQQKARQIEKDSKEKVVKLENEQKQIRLDSLLLSNKTN